MTTPPSAAPTGRRTPATTWRIDATPIRLRCEDDERAHPQQGGRQGARAAPVMCLDEVADRQVLTPLRLLPDARADPQGQQQRAYACRPVPPPGAEPLSVAQAGSTHGGARADVRCQHRREQQHGWQGTASNEEVARAADPPSN